MKTLNESKPFYLRFTDTHADKVFVTLECLYGFDQTKTGTLERIVNLTLPWSSIGIHHPLSGALSWSPERSQVRADFSDGAAARGGGG